MHPLPTPRHRPAARRRRTPHTIVALALLLASGTAAAAPGLVLATWNIEHLAAADGAGCRPRDESDFAALRAVVLDLDADIIALQEVENADAAARVFDPAVYALVIAERPAAPREECHGMAGQRRTAQRTGFAIHRGRLAALGLHWRELPAFAEVGGDGGRTGTRIRIEPNTRPTRDDDGGSLELMALHLKSGCGWGALGADDEARRLHRGQCLTLRRQRGILEEWIDDRAAANQPFVLLGDFNRQLDQPGDHFWQAIDDGAVCDWRHDPDLGRRCRPGSRAADADADLTLAGAGRPYPFPYNPRYPFAIDHLVFGGGAADWLLPRSYRVLGFGRGPAPSDHHPIRVELRLPWAGG